MAIEGLSVWLFVPQDASEGISELQAIISEGGLDPIEVFVVGREGVMHQKQPGREFGPGTRPAQR